MTFVKMAFVGFVALALASHCSAQGGVLLSDSEMKALGGQATLIAGLMARCDRELGHAATPVEELAPPDHYGPNGVVKPVRPPTLGPDGQVAYRAALCFALTGESKFAAHAQSILDTWSGTLRRVTSPQGRANVNFSFPYFVIAAGWVRGAGGWNDTNFRAFIEQSILPLASTDRVNNHGNWGVLLEAAIGGYLSDRTVLERSRNRWQALMLSQVADDGSLPLEVCRSDTNNWCGGDRKGVSGLSYTHFALLPTSLTAQILERSGMPVWNSAGGAQLQKAFARAAGWVQRPETFPHYSAERPLHGVRNAAYFFLLQKHYPNDWASRVIADGHLDESPFELQLLFGSQRRSIEGGLGR